MSHYLVAIGRRVDSATLGAIGEPYPWDPNQYAARGFPAVNITVGLNASDATTTQERHSPSLRMAWGLITRATLTDFAEPEYDLTGAIVGYRGHLTRLLGALEFSRGGGLGRRSQSPADAADHGYHAPVATIATVASYDRGWGSSQAGGTLPHVLMNVAGTVQRSSRASVTAEGLVASMETAYDDARDALAAYVATPTAGSKATWRAACAAYRTLAQSYNKAVAASMLEWLEANLP